MSSALSLLEETHKDATYELDVPLQQLHLQFSYQEVGCVGLLPHLQVEFLLTWDLHGSQFPMDQQINRICGILRCSTASTHFRSQHAILQLSQMSISSTCMSWHVNKYFSADPHRCGVQWAKSHISEVLQKRERRQAPWFYIYNMPTNFSTWIPLLWEISFMPGAFQIPRETFILQTDCVLK